MAVNKRHIGGAAMMKRNLEKYYHEKVNRRLKYAALASAGLGIAMIVASVVALGRHGDMTTVLLCRGFAGLFIIIFVVLMSILLYRVNSAFFKDLSNKATSEN